jgi:Zn-dependent peptidase ImmA (M78 family)
VQSTISEAGRRLVEGFRSLGSIGAPDRDALERFVETASAYAQIEVAALGAIDYALPAHSGVTATTARGQGEELAARERVLLGQEGEAEVDLGALLEEQGLKVITASVESDLGSVFAFEAALGPAVFVNARGAAGDDRFWLAHAYAHLIADIDPYRVRVCRPGESLIVAMQEIDLDEWFASAVDLSPESIAASEERANAFAEALLLPTDLLTAFVSGARRETGHALSPEVLLQMESYFGASATRIGNRLVHLGALEPDAAAVLVRQADVRRPASPPAERPPGLPRRMLDLAAGAFCRATLSVEGLARILGTGEEAVTELLSVYDLSRDAAGGARLPDEGDGGTHGRGPGDAGGKAGRRGRRRKDAGERSS